MHLREILPSDNRPLASIIRFALKEHGADKPGTVYYDDSTDHLYELFRYEGSFYLVVQDDDVILGGCGLYPTEGLPEGRVELVKMYLDSSARGKGIAISLLDACIDKAKELGYREVYIETMPELKKAISIYERYGFEYLPAPSGNSCHSDCTIWMLKKIDN